VREKKKGKAKTKTKRMSLGHTSFKLVSHKNSNFISFGSVNVCLYRDNNIIAKMHLRKYIFEDNIQKGSSIVTNNSLPFISRFSQLCWATEIQYD